MLPAAAAALWALTVAARPASSLLLTAAATTLAILLRQDNILIVPGVAAGVALGAAPGNRAGGVVRVLVGAGLATAAALLRALEDPRRDAVDRVALPVRARGLLDRTQVVRMGEARRSTLLGLARDDGR